MPLRINRKKKSTDQHLGFKLKQMHHNCHFHIIYFPFKAFLIQILITEYSRNGSKFYMAFPHLTVNIGKWKHLEERTISQNALTYRICLPQQRLLGRHVSSHPPILLVICYMTLNIKLISKDLGYHSKTQEQFPTLYPFKRKVGMSEKNCNYMGL